MKLEDFGIEPDPVIEAYKKDVDRTLLRENLKRTPEERLEQLTRLLAFARSLQEGARQSREKARQERLA